MKDKQSRVTTSLGKTVSGDDVDDDGDDDGDDDDDDDDDEEDDDWKKSIDSIRVHVLAKAVDHESGRDHNSDHNCDHNRDPDHHHHHQESHPVLRMAPHRLPLFVDNVSLSFVSPQQRGWSISSASTAQVSARGGISAYSVLLSFHYPLTLPLPSFTFRAGKRHQFSGCCLPVGPARN